MEGISDPESSDEGYEASHQASLFSAANTYSTSTAYSTSAPKQSAQIEVLLNQFFKDEQLNASFRQAFHDATDFKEFALGLTATLEIFVEDLKDEAQDSLQFLAANFISTRVDSMVSAVLHRYGLVSQAELRSWTLSGANTSAHSELDSDPEFPNISLLLRYLKESNAFRSLKEHIKEFVLRKPVNEQTLLLGEIEATLQLATQRANSAVLLDKVGSLEAAVYAYRETCGYLEEVLPYVVDRDGRNRLESTVSAVSDKYLMYVSDQSRFQAT